MSSAGCAVRPWTELGKQWQQGQHKAAFQQKATLCSHQLLARPWVPLSPFSTPRPAVTCWPPTATRSAAAPRTPPSPRACTGTQCSQLGQHFCSALSPHSLPSVLVSLCLSPATSQAEPCCLQTQLPNSQFPRLMQTVPLVPLRSPRASMLWAGAVEKWKPSPAHHPKPPYSQHNVYLPKLLQRRHQEPQPAPPPSSGCWEGFTTQSIISSLSGFNGQLSTQLLPARLIYCIKRHFSSYPCLYTVIKLPPAYQSLGYPRQSFISWDGLFSSLLPGTLIFWITLHLFQF